MSEQNEAYRVIRGAIRLPRGTEGTGFMMSRKDMVMQGELLPPGIFPESDIESWLSEGRIERAGVSIEQAEQAAEIRAQNPFRVDPATLVGKTMEDLVIMVLEIDDEYDVDQLADEQAAVQLLTSGWEPSMRQTVAPVNDRSRPEALALHKLEQEEGGGSAIKSGDREMSQEAKAGLEAARAKAQAPSDEDGE